MKEDIKIRWKNLNGWLKAAVIGGWLALFGFILGFIEGLLVV